MISFTKAVRPWKTCYRCGSVVLPDPRWLENDWFRCQESARRRRTEYIRRNEAVYHKKLRERQGHILPEASLSQSRSDRHTRRPDRSRDG